MKTRRGLARRGLVSLCFAVAALFSGLTGISPAAGENACRTPQAALPVTRSIGGHLAVDAQINGEKVHLLVDTGAPFSALTPEAIEKLNLDVRLTPRNLVRMFYGGARMDKHAEVTDLQFSGAKAVAADFMQAPPNFLHKDVDGVIGMDVLKNFDAEFDFTANTIRLRDKGSCAADPQSWLHASDTVQFAYSPEDKQIRIPVTIDDKDIAGLIDTGMPNSRISMDSAKAVFGLSEDSKGMVKFGLDPRHVFYRYPFKSISIAQIKIDDPGISIDPFSRSATNAFQAILGLSVLNHFRMYIDAKNDMLYMRPATAHKAD